MKSKMRDGLIQRGKGRWTAAIVTGYSDPDPVTGKRRILQKWVSLGKCTRQEAKAKREELLVAVRRNEFVAPAQHTLGEWLTTWMTESVRPARRMNTVAVYEFAITKHIAPALGSARLQALRPGHLAKYDADKRAAGLSGATRQVHHAVISSALKSAVRQGLVTRNVATLVNAKPQATVDRERAKQDCWSAKEARAFLKAATDAGTQVSALFHLALDTGARRGELLGLRWSDVDLDAGTVVIDRTLLVSGAELHSGVLNSCTLAGV